MNTEKSLPALWFRAKSGASGAILTSNSFRVGKMRWDFSKSCEQLMKGLFCCCREAGKAGGSRAKPGGWCMAWIKP